MKNELLDEMRRLVEFAREPAQTAGELDLAFEQAVQPLRNARYRRYPRRLLRLAREVMPGIAAHPNASPTLLARVIEYAPEAFCANPLASLVALEDPEWTRRVSDQGLRLLLRLPQTPPSLVALIAAGNVTDPQRSDQPYRTLDAYIPLAERLCPEAIPLLVGESVPPRVREARDHVALAPEIETAEEWMRAVRLRYFLAYTSSRRWEGEEEWVERSRCKALSRGWRRRRLAAPLGAEGHRESWWFRAGVAAGARPLVGSVWSPSIRRMLRELCEDGHRLVRAAARLRLADPYGPLYVEAPLSLFDRTSDEGGQVSSRMRGASGHPAAPRAIPTGGC